MLCHALSMPCHAQVNGEVIETALRSFQASYGPVAARDCALAVEGADQPWECGAAREVILQPKQLKQGERA